MYFISENMKLYFYTEAILKWTRDNIHPDSFKGDFLDTAYNKCFRSNTF